MIPKETLDTLEELRLGYPVVNPDVLLDLVTAYRQLESVKAERDKAKQEISHLLDVTRDQHLKWQDLAVLKEQPDGVEFKRIKSDNERLAYELQQAQAELAGLRAIEIEEYQRHKCKTEEFTAYWFQLPKMLAGNHKSLGQAFDAAKKSTPAQS